MADDRWLFHEPIHLDEMRAALMNRLPEGWEIVGGLSLGAGQDEAKATVRKRKVDEFGRDIGTEAKATVRIDLVAKRIRDEDLRKLS